jgi:uncharacterized protein YdaU (DUF1376 family)
MGGMGHNSATYGEELRDQVETILGDDHETTFRYAQWHIGDYITGTMGMQLEQEGAYIRFLMRLYQRGKPLPDDDKFMATCMNLSLRVWKRVKDSLIAVGKIIAKAGCLTNARFEKERLQRAETMRKQAEAARQRWERQRAEKMGLTEVSGKFAPSLDETCPKLSQSTEKKLNKINEPVLTDHMLTINQYPLTNKKEPPLIPLEGETPKRVRSSRGDRTRLPKDWVLPLDWRARTKEKFGATDAQIDKEAERFWRYWTSPDAKNPLKADWLGTWENWFDRAMERGVYVNGSRSKSPDVKPADMPDFIWERAQRAKREALS